MFNPLIQSLLITGGCEIARRAGGYVISVAIKNAELAPLVIGTQWFATKAQMAHTDKVGREIKHHIDKGLQGTNAKIDDLQVGTFSRLDNIQASVQGLQSLPASLGVLQASTAVIGVGVVAVAALSAVNLYQTMKLREDVKQLRLEVKDGFIDLKEALKYQGKEILERIDLVAQDVEFRHHRTIVAQAYGYFVQANKLMQKAMLCEDLSIRNNTLETAKGILTTALANYNNPQLLSDTCAAGLLRRYECAWAIEQTMAMVFQMQEQPAVVSQSLSDLKNRIRKDTLTVINKCETEAELDFIFPEITRVHDHDLAVLESWQNHIDWLRTLPESELKLLESAEFKYSEIAKIADSDSTTTALEIPPEIQLYESLKQKSHPQSLLDQMRLMMQPELRRQYELYVSERSAIAQHKTLTQPNLQQASNLAIANLYWYFKHREQTPALEQV
ncbi:hypothetical protein [[Phormidium] sp. LEGE 05292]|uniref:hypothetical protein n=1 Tax=[Phormidium] sp. LEGE 05292 TaxID=767427 RepID=UPI001D154EE6|nr:hypothetical protein [Phormidium sp. LEGE 05292]